MLNKKSMISRIIVYPFDGILKIRFMKNALYQGINSLLSLLKSRLYPCVCIILFLKVYIWKIIIYIVYSVLGRVLFLFCQFDTNYGHLVK